MKRVSLLARLSRLENGNVHEAHLGKEASG